MSCARHSSVFASCDACQAPFRREAERNATIADLRAKLAAAEADNQKLATTLVEECVKRAAAERAFRTANALCVDETARADAAEAALVTASVSESAMAVDRDEAEEKVILWVTQDAKRLVDRVEAAEAACERLRHGQQIEGDYVCPNELRATTAEAEAKRLRAALTVLKDRVELHVGLRPSGRDTWPMLSTGLEHARAALAPSSGGGGE